MAKQRARYVGQGPSGVTVDGRELSLGDVVSRPASLVQHLLELPGWQDADLTAAPLSAPDLGDGEDTPTSGAADPFPDLDDEE